MSIKYSLVQSLEQALGEKEKEVERLQAVEEAVKKYIEVKTKADRPTPEEWASYEAKWQGVV